MIFGSVRLWGCILAVMLILSFANPGYGEQAMAREDISTLLEEEMLGVRDHMKSLGESRVIAEELGVDLLPFLKQYLNDDSGRVRRAAYELLMRVGESSDSAKVRRDVVFKLVESLDDNDMIVRGRTVEWLQDFRAEDFSDASKRLIRKKLRALDEERYQQVSRGIVLLAGVADMKSELPLLALILKENEHRFDSEFWHGSMAWAALRARARMGVKEDIKRCIELVETHSEERRVRFFLKEIAYVRQPEIVEYLQGYLESDKVIPASGCVVEDRYAERAETALREMLVDFPPVATFREFRNEHPAWHQDRYPDFAFARGEQHRQWMREQKEWNLHR